MRTFMKIKASQNGEITVLFTDVSNSCPSREFLMSQICLLTLLAKSNYCENFAFTVNSHEIKLMKRYYATAA